MNKLKIVNKIKIVISIFLLITLCTSCNDYANNKEEENIQNTSKENNKDYNHKVSVSDAYIIDLRRAKLSDESFDNYYIELPPMEEGKRFWFPNYHIGFENIFYTVAYEKSDTAGGFPYVELYAKNIKTGKKEIIKQLSQTRIFDLCSVSSYAYWYEQKLEDNNNRIIKMDLKSRKINEIINFESSEMDIFGDEVKLSTSDEFLIIWTKSKDNELDFDDKLVLYNHFTSEFSELHFKDIVSETAGKLVYTTSPHVNDNFITFFSKNDKNELFINRYDLKTKEKLSVLIIGNQKLIDEENTIREIPYKYMSSKEWICWFEQGGMKRILIYNIKNKKLYSVNKDSSYTIYSVLLKDNTLYINADTPNCKIFKLKLDSEASEIGLRSNMEIQGYTSLRDGVDMYSSYFQVQEGGKVYLYTDVIDNDREKNIYMIE